jgi:indolepyruvate ferredoxin oxidoreductase
VAMTGGQPVDGAISVDAIARQVESEGVRRVAVVSDDIGKYDALRSRFPAGTSFHPREELDALQRELRAIAGVTVLIYEQTCAAEKRRRRKKGELADPDRRLFINEHVCEGCGDCGVQSNCVAVLPHETPGSLFGRKRRIDQSSCNKDYSCAKGFCPSFVSVHGARIRRRTGVLGGGQDVFRQRVASLPRPPEHVWTGPYDLLVTGVGGTGVVTVGAVIAMAAHLEGKHASVLDFMGFAQKGGSVLSFVRWADRRDRLNQVRIDTQQADALLACDLVVGASADALGTVRRGRTKILANVHETPVAESLKNPDASLRVPDLLDKLRFAVGADDDPSALETFDAQALAETFLGDTITSNILALGYAWQRGLVPVSLEALQRAIELNGVAVANNLTALSLGRLAAGDPQALQALLAAPAGTDAAAGTGAEEPLAALMDRAAAHLTAWQDAAWADRFRATIARVRDAEQARSADPGLPFTRAAARSLLKLMSYKDEYEVARLYTDGRFLADLQAQFEGDLKLQFHMAPPLLSRSRDGQPPRKITLGPWLMPALRLLARGKRLRGTALDLFGRTDERRMERALITQFEERLDELLPYLAAADSRALATQVAALPMTMRGYGHVKIGQVALARAREAELLHRLDPRRWPAPPRPPQAGQLRGIAVVAAGS